MVQTPSSQSPSEPSTVKATLLYFNPPTDGSRPFQTVNSNPATGKRDRNWTQEEHIVEIENLRGKEDTVSLDTAGFQFLSHESKHKAFTDDKEIEREYYPESAEFIKKVTGASKVVLFDHTIRRSNPNQIGDTPDTRKPVSQVHVDQTSGSAVARVHRHVPDLAPELLKHRFQIINLWRPISHPAYDFPLSLCDYRSVDAKADLVPTTLRYPDRDGETNSVKFNENHRWKYVRGMRPDEVVMIKCYDTSSDSSVAIFTPHTAFVDPSTPEGSPLRQSIELRALVFYDDQIV